MQKIVVSNIRFKYEDWLQLKTMASTKGMSINEYLTCLARIDAIKATTGTRNMRVKDKGYKAMDAFINRQRTGKPMGASDDDKIIYGID